MRLWLFRIIATLLPFAAVAETDGQSPARPAVEAALRSGRALCKVVSPTDAGRSGSRQGGIYLPRQAWRAFSSRPPVEEENHREAVTLRWADGLTSQAMLHWYGKGTRSEFRLTRTTSQITEQHVGDLLVLIPQGAAQFSAHLLNTDAAMEEFYSALSLEPATRWSVYEKGTAATAAPGSIEAWAAREAEKHAAFPSGKTMAALARQAVTECRPGMESQSADERLLAWMEAEYAIYRAIESRLCAAQVQQKFATVEEFLNAAATIANRRKSRAGHSLEAHVEHLLREAGITFEAQATIDGSVKPDILLPGRAAYEDPGHPANDLVVLGLKTTCRDRWRQVLNEGKRVPAKHLLTLQPAMSQAQLEEMREARLQLIVPAPLHNGYDLPPGSRLLSVAEFVQEMRRRFPR